MSNFWDAHKTCGEISCEECNDRYERLHTLAQAYLDAEEKGGWAYIEARTALREALKNE